MNMALYRCPECRNEVSDKASKCPNCGCPIDPATLREAAKADEEVRDGLAAKWRWQQIVAGILVALGLMLAIGALDRKDNAATPEDEKLAARIILAGVVIAIVGVGWILAVQEAKAKFEQRRAPIGGCPKCGATTVTGLKEGYGAGEGCCGFALCGPLGLLCGFHGSKEVNVHCLSCGHKWRAK